MIVLLVSLDEARALYAGRPDMGLKRYLAAEMSLERVLPDDNLPTAVLLRGLELDDGQRNYVAAIRSYATTEAADRAWEDVADERTDEMFELRRD